MDTESIQNVIEEIHTAMGNARRAIATIQGKVRRREASSIDALQQHIHIVSFQLAVKTRLGSAVLLNYSLDETDAEELSQARIEALGVLETLVILSGAFSIEELESIFTQIV